MADFGPLGFGTYATLTVHTIQGTEPVLELIASADDTDFTYDNANTSHTGIAAFDIANSFPTDFGQITTINVNLRYAMITATSNNLWELLDAQLITSGGATLTDRVTVASDITATTPANSGDTALTNPNTTATTSDWNSARLYLYTQISKNKGGDTATEAIFAAEISGTYATAAAVEDEALVFTKMMTGIGR